MQRVILSEHVLKWESYCTWLTWRAQPLLYFITLGCWRATKSLSATNSMYCLIRPQFMPIKLTGRASVKNCNIEENYNKNHTLLPFTHFIIDSLTSCSILTASQMMARILSGDGLCFSLVKSKQAKSQWRPSSLLINSLENVRPGMRPLLARAFEQV